MNSGSEDKLVRMIYSFCRLDRLPMESGKEDKLPIAVSSTCRFGKLPKKSSTENKLFPPIPSSCRFDRLPGKLIFWGLSSNACGLDRSLGELVVENELSSHMYSFFSLDQ